jgi:hypothetical protein
VSRFLSRQIKIYKICWDFLRIIKISWLFEGLHVQKSQQIEKSWSRKMIKLTYSLSRLWQTVGFIKNFRSWRISRSCQDFWDWKVASRQNWDKLYETVKIFLTVETCFLPLSRLRHDGEKSRPPSLALT